MKTSTIKVRIEPMLKKETEDILNTLSLTLSEAINIFLHQVYLHQGIPFEVKIPPVNFNETTLNALNE